MDRLLELIVLQAQNAREFRGAKRTEAMERLFKSVLLARSHRVLNDEVRKRFVNDLKACEYVPDSLVKMSDVKNVVRIEGEFDFAELAKKFVW